MKDIFYLVFVNLLIFFFNLQKIHIAINNPSISLEDEVYPFIQKLKKRKNQQSKQVLHGDDHLSTLIPRLSPIVPKVSIILTLLENILFVL